MLLLSIFYLVPISENATLAIALQNARNLALHVEDFSNRRYWVVEHYIMAGIASAATSVVIGFMAATTKPTEWVLVASCCPTTRLS